MLKFMIFFVEFVQRLALFYITCDFQNKQPIFGFLNFYNRYEFKFQKTVKSLEIFIHNFNDECF